MFFNGELTTGAVGIIVTILGGILAWWVKSDRQSTRFDIMIAALQSDIKANRDAYTSALVEIRSDLKSQDRSIDEVKLQLAAMSAQQNMGSMFASLPDTLGRAVSDAVRQARAREREKDAA